MTLLGSIYILVIRILFIELSETANAIEIQNLRKYKSVSISEKTYNRLAKYGHWSESADQLINKILDQREGKEVGEYSAS
jgi:hypothetical protein